MHQNPGQELADNLKGCMSKALRKYHEFNGSFPERIVVYRDGVGDGQVCVCVCVCVRERESACVHLLCTNHLHSWLLLFNMKSLSSQQASGNKEATS